jgi:nitrile hydratase subunit beta
MNGPQDLGGLQGFGPVMPDPQQAIFHAPWEAKAMAIVVAMGATGSWNIDRSRFLRESLPPAVYYASSYYEIWMGGLEALLIDKGLVNAQELALGQNLGPAKALSKTLRADDVAATLLRGSPTLRELPSAKPQFAPGDWIVAINEHPTHHTRLPRYVRGKAGKILSYHGFHVFPDTNAQGLGEAPQALYTVEFDAKALWGDQTSASTVCVDCFESYLRPFPK